MKTLRPIILSLLVVALLGFAPPKSDPKAQALRIMQVFHKENWKDLYSLIAFSPSMKKTLPGKDKFASDVKSGMDSSSSAAIVHELFASMKDIRVGEAAVHGLKATVPTACTVTVQGHTKKFKGQANLAKDDGVWKLDLSGSGDLATQTSKAVQDLLGKPVG